MMRRIPVAVGIAVGAHPDCGKYKHLFGADAVSTSDLAVIGGGAADGAAMGIGFLLGRRLLKYRRGGGYFFSLVAHT
jgi:hypothetical protein